MMDDVDRDCCDEIETLVKKALEEAPWDVERVDSSDPSRALILRHKDRGQFTSSPRVTLLIKWGDWGGWDQFYSNRESDAPEQEPTPVLQVKTSYVAGEAQCCPVCRGSRAVPNGFYAQTSGSWTTNSSTSEPCKTCSATGVVFTPERVESAPSG
jgi:hypothetical protein